MYEIQKTKAFDDTLRLVDGERQLDLHISFTINMDLLTKFRKLQLRIAELQREQAAGRTDAIAVPLGQALVETMQLLLGVQNTEDILLFYGGDNTQMLCDVYPYITQVLVPEMQKACKERKKQLVRQRRWY